MPARTNQNTAATSALMPAVTPVRVTPARVTPARGTAAARSTPQATQQTALKAEADDVDVSALVIDEQKPTGRAKARTVSQVSIFPHYNEFTPKV
jgi:hypothetical protein